MNTELDAKRKELLNTIDELQLELSKVNDLIKEDAKWEATKLFKGILESILKMSSYGYTISLYTNLGHFKLCEEGFQTRKLCMVENEKPSAIINLVSESFRPENFD